MGRKR